MSLTDILLLVVLLVLIVALLLNVRLYASLRGGQKTDGEAVPVAEEMDEDEKRRSREMDEGIDNILSYQVKLGRGKMTGGEPF